MRRVLLINLKRSGIIAIAAMLIVVLALVGCGTAEDPDDPGAAEDREPIVVIDNQWQSLWINNAIAEFIMQEGYGYPVETVTVTTSVARVSLRNGDAHVHTELWRFNDYDWYTEATEAGDVIDLGPIFDTSTQGWYVPRYVIEGDEERGIEPMAPGLESVFDLPDHWEIFQDPDDPEKGLFVNSALGSDATDINEIKFEVYGLTDYYNVRSAGGAASLDVTLAGAYERGEPLLAYYWEPTWLLGLYDYVLLEEPEYDEEVWADIERAMHGEIDASDLEEACAYKEHAVHKGIHASLKERAPEVVEFLDAMHVGSDSLNETMAVMETENLDGMEAAFYYFENYQEEWRSWLPAEVEERVEAALIGVGVDL